MQQPVPFLSTVSENSVWKAKNEYFKEDDAFDLNFWTKFLRSNRKRSFLFT